MAVKSRQIDWGGMDLIVRDILIATKPGAAQTDLTATDVKAIAGVTAGTVAASKALIVDSSKNLATLGTVAMTALTATTGTFSGAVSATTGTFTGTTNNIRPVVVNTATATDAVTSAQSGALYVMSKADGIVLTLPAPVVGLWYEVVIDTTVTSNNYKVITNAGSVFMRGTVFGSITATPTITADTGNGSTHIAVTMNGTTTGGYVGTTLRFVCTSATEWDVSGFVPKTGSVATIFATS